MSFGADGVSVVLGGHAALDRVSVEVRPGAVTAIVGGDGAGKTTLLRLLSGAAAPGSGTVRLPAVERIGYLPAGSGTYPDLSVEENLAFCAAAYGVAPREARERAREYLERTGLAGARDRPAGALSGGMRQKLGVIKAMVHRPALLVLDEPTTGVDPVSRRDLWWLIVHAAADGAAVVLSTCYVDEAERAEEVVVLDGGRVLAAGEPGAIVAAMPGRLYRLGGPPPVDRTCSWRRGPAWRVWSADGSPPRGPGVEPVAPDLDDAVIVASLARQASGTVHAA